MNSQKSLSQQERDMLSGIMPTQHTLQNGSKSFLSAIQTPVQKLCQCFWISAIALLSTISVKTRINSNCILKNMHLSKQEYLTRILPSTDQLVVVGRFFFSMMYHCSTATDDIDLEISRNSGKNEEKSYFYNINQVFLML